tara:strand:+ start:920 stop:1180 length:261 start_codon:yes stop_codon:yes gene_type:complete
MLISFLKEHQANPMLSMYLGCIYLQFLYLLKYNLPIYYCYLCSNNKRTLDISEIVLSEYFLAIGLLASTFMGFALLVNQKIEEDYS